MLEKWIKTKLAKGDQRAVRFGKFMAAEFGDEPFASPSSTISSKEPQTAKAETVKVYPELSLEQEWQRQAQRFIDLGFHTELGFKTPEEYTATLPKFEAQPKEWKGRLDTPVIVETRVTPERQAKLAGLQYFLGGLNKADWNQKLKDYTSPEPPYAAWLDDGRNHMNKSVKEVRENLKADELAGTEFDGIALYVSNPKILEHHFMDLPGTSVGSGGAACLRLWSVEPKVYYYFVSHAGPVYGSVVRGRQK